MNCKKFRERYEILKDNWDILIIQECNDPEQYDTIYKRWAKNDNQSLWEGDNKDRGLGIFVKKHIKIEDLREKKSMGKNVSIIYVQKKLTSIGLNYQRNHQKS